MDQRYAGAASPSPSLDSVDMTTPSPPAYDSSPHNAGQLRRRHAAPQYGAHAGGANGHPSSSPDGDDDKYRKGRRLARKLDMFPKVQEDLAVKTDRGGMLTLVGYGIIAVLVVAEVISFRAENRALVEHAVVDKSLGKKMRVDLNITFPALHCDDLHVDAMDVAGDSQINVADTLIKRRLHLDGRRYSDEEIRVEMNKAAQEDAERREKVDPDKAVGPDYCGSCYGAHDADDDCCNTCDDVIEAYKRKRWGSAQVVSIAEQCKREGRAEKSAPRAMLKGQGCNLSGYMSFNRVAGNFHIAMGEGVERDGRHIHQFLPEDAPNFNASHVIHKLSFGPDYSAVYGRTEGTTTSLDGVTKVVTEENGSTGLFQYFIKIVPTSYKGRELIQSLPAQSLAELKKSGEWKSSGSSDDNDDGDAAVALETNRYFFTERFRPLMTDAIEEEHRTLGEEKDVAGVHAGGGTGVGSHSLHEHHRVQNSILPGVFFVYEIYPFAVEVTRNTVPFTHLLIRVMATVGGVFTIIGWADAALYARDKKRRRNR